MAIYRFIACIYVLKQDTDETQPLPDLRVETFLETPTLVESQLFAPGPEEVKAESLVPPKVETGKPEVPDQGVPPDELLEKPLNVNLLFTGPTEETQPVAKLEGKPAEAAETQVPAGQLEDELEKLLVEDCELICVHPYII